MNKQELIENIRERNRSVSDEYLVRFNEQALESYLQRLTHVVGHRGRNSRWVRQGDGPASVTREPVNR
ncbi:MAG: hypothetical protein WD009_15060 [Phycisphaeraceae bacterium]